MRSHLIRACASLGLVLATLVVGAVPASAAHDVQKAIWGPVMLNGVSQFPIYEDLGVDIYQASVDWRTIARVRPADAADPTDPAYSWPKDLDMAVSEAKRHGIAVNLLVQRSPAWANGGGEANVPPSDPQDYATFVEALARRYPSVHLFMVWGEPIRFPNYKISSGAPSPNYYVQRGRGTTRLPVFTPAQRADVGHYAEIVDATYGRLKALDRKNRIIGGNTTTSGDVDPFNWVRWMRLPNGKPPRMDFFGHNPFGTRGPDLRKKQLVAGTADISDLDVFVPWIDRYLARAGRNRKLPLFLSEFTVPTDVPSYEFPIHVTRQLQAKWLTDGLRIAKRWSRIYSFGWIGLRDRERPDGTETRTGLIDGKGIRKPSYYAYKRG